MANIASTMSGSSATLNVGEGITGVLVVQKDPVNIEEISLAYGSPQGSINVGAFDFICYIFSKKTVMFNV